jgi:hypothetical protein
MLSSLAIMENVNSESGLLATSKPIEGFRKIPYKEVDNIIT